MAGEPAWKVAGVSVAGPSHATEDGTCQDAHTIAVAPDGRLVALVSDGAGSTTHGGEAARLICERLPALLLAAFPPPDVSLPITPRGLVQLRRAIVRAVSEVRDSLLAHATRAAIEPDDLLATLVGAVAHPRVGGVFLHIGDGAAIGLDATGATLAFSAPENGEYVNTTYFLIEEGWKGHLRVCFFAPGFRTLLLMSDGVTELAFVRGGEGLTPFRAFFDPVCRFLGAADRRAGEAALRSMLDGEAARSKVDDDKTVIWLEAAA